MKSVFKMGLLATSAALALTSAPSLAQSGDGASSQPDVITVTALRREQDLQQTPAAVTALTTALIEERQVRNVLDLQYQTPNISLATNTGTASGARVFLRGIGEDESRVSADPAVGMYVDGVYIGRQVGALFDLVDLERIEVLRGPQGTLYGRNSNGGAIKLISRQPADENAFRLGTTVGSDSRFDLRGMANLAVGENTGIRAAALYRSRDGFHTLNPNGDFAGQGGNVGAVDTTGFRVTATHDFSPEWSATLALDHVQDDSDPVPDSANPGDDGDNDLFTIEPIPGDVCSAFVPLEFLSMGCFTDYRSEVTSQGAALTVSGDLGNWDFQSITGFRSMEDDLASRIGFPYFQETDQDQFSQEFTLTSQFDGPANYVLGLFVFNEDVTLDSTFVFPFTLGIETEAWALFGQGVFDLSERTSITGGLRYTSETKEIDAANLAFATTQGFARNESRDFENWTYNISVDHDLTDNAMIYASYATGFKSGGWSPDCFGTTACFLPVDEETVDTIELGLRSTSMDGRLRFNATYFHNVYEGLQIGATVPGLGFTRFNVDETKISGLEIEATLAASEALEFYATYGTLDGEYTEVTLTQAGGLTNSGASCPDGIVTVQCALNLELKNAPSFKGTLGARFETGFANGSLVFNGDIGFEDESWSLVANDPAHALTAPDTIINARMSYSPNSQNWQISLWGKNLTDEEYGRAATAGSFSVYAAEPLTWGVDLDVNF